MLFDEPLTHLDVALRRELLEVFRRLLAERGATALYVTHDPREAVSLGDRIAVLENGEITRTGSWADLTGAPAAGAPPSAFLSALRQFAIDRGPGAATGRAAPESPVSD